MPPRRGRSRAALTLVGLLLGGLAAAGVILGTGALSSKSNKQVVLAKVTPTVATSPTPPARPTTPPTVPPTQQPTATPTPRVPTFSLTAGAWDIQYTLTSTTCQNRQSEVGKTTLSMRVQFQEAKAGNKTISDKDLVDVLDADGKKQTQTTFTWPVLRYSLKNADGSTGLFYTEFFDSDHGWARMDQHVPVQGGGECVIVWEEPRPPGFTPTGPLP